MGKAVEVTLNSVVHVDSISRDEVWDAFLEFIQNEPDMAREMISFESLEPETPKKRRRGSKK